jgi:hypothetical protein
MLTMAAHRKLSRALEEMRRGRVSSREMADSLIERLKDKGLRVVEEEPDLDAMAVALVAAGYRVEAPAEPPEAPNGQ